MAHPSEPKVNTLSETSSYMIWQSVEPDGETLYHIEVNNVTLHFFEEEWLEFCELVKKLPL